VEYGAACVHEYAASGSTIENGLRQLIEHPDSSRTTSVQALKRLLQQL